MSRKLIVQIGRIDGNYRNKINFKFEEEEGSEELSSIFISKLKKIGNVESLMIFPESIILRDWSRYIGDDDFLSTLKEVNIESYLENPEKYLLKHPHINSSTKILVLSSMGRFSYKNKEIQLQTSLERITLQIFLYLVNTYSHKNLSEVYFDNSSGQNIYIVAFINALYRFLPFMKFYKFLEKDNNSVKGHILSSDPIFGTPNYPIHIQKSNFSARAFNTLVYKDHTIINEIVKVVLKETSYYKELRFFFESDYFLLHGSLIHYTPLMVAMTDFERLNIIFNNNNYQDIFNVINRYFSRANNDFNLSKDQINQVFNLCFALAIGRSIYKEMREIIKSKSINFKIESPVVIKNNQLSYIYNLIHDEYGQPKLDYKGDILKIIKFLRENRLESLDKYTSYAELMLTPNSEYSLNQSFSSRNYFAHAGFEMNITQIKYNGRAIILRYDEEIVRKQRKNILKYIKN